MKILEYGPIVSKQVDGEIVETMIKFFWGDPKSLQMLTAAMTLKEACSLEEKLWPASTAY